MRSSVQLFPGAMGLVLDCLDASEPSLRHMCRSWLSLALAEHLPHIVDPLFEDLLTNDIQRGFPDPATDPSAKHRVYLQEYDTVRTTFVLSRLTSLVRAEPAVLIAAAQSKPPSLAILQANALQCCQAEDTGLRGYADDQCVADYLDLFCVVATRFIMTETSSELQSGFARLNLMVQSSAAEFLRIFLTSASSALPPSRRTEVCIFLAAPLLSFFTSCNTTTLHVQCLDVLRIIVPIALQPVPASLSAAVAAAAGNAADLDVYSRALAAKATQLNRLGTLVSLVSNVLPATVRILKSSVLSDTQMRVEVLYSSTLARLIDFPLFLCQLVPESHPDASTVYQSILVRFTSLLSSPMTSIVPCYHLLRGLEAMLQLLLRGGKRGRRPVTLGLWASVFGTSDAGGGGVAEGGGASTPAWTVFRDNCPAVLQCLATAAEHSWPADSTRRQSLRRDNANDLIRQHTAKHDSDLAVSEELVQFQVRSIAAMLFDRAPQELLLSILHLCRLEPTADTRGVKPTLLQALSTAEGVAIEDVLRALLPLLTASLKGAGVRRQNSGITGQQQQQPGDRLKLPPNYLPRAVEALALLDRFLEAFRARLSSQEEWNAMAEVLTAVLGDAVQPTEYLWALAILQRLDAYKPSRESFFGPGNVKRVRRDIQDLSNVVSQIASQQFHLHRNLTIDLSPPLPPAEDVLRQLTPPGAPLYLRCPNKANSNDGSGGIELVPEQDAVACAALLALAAMISVSRQLHATQKRTLVGGSLASQFGALCHKMVLQAALRGCSVETLYYRYLGLHCAESLPIDLVPSAVVPAKQLLIEFINSPAFGVPSGVFAQASPGINTGVMLFRGFDRQCLRSLAASIRRGCEAEPDPATLIDTLTLSRPAGVFTSRETDLWRKARELKRLSFTILSCRKDFFLPKMPSVIQRVLESLKVESPNVPSQVWLHEQVRVPRRGYRHIRRHICVSGSFFFGQALMLCKPSGRSC